MSHLKMLIFGFAYGISSPIPGFDGGTFFILFNMYERFIHAANLRNIRKKLPVVTPFAIGCIAGLLSIGVIMMYLLDNFQMIMHFVFMGLIIGCIPMIYRKSALDISKHKLKITNIIIFIIALAIMLLLSFITTDSQTYDYLYPIYDVPVPLIMVFFASAVSSVGMLIPGVGGAILMLVLGIYTIYIEALATRDWQVLLTLVGGMVFGILCGIKVVKKILVTYPHELYCAILGFTFGSVVVVFPGFAANFEGLLSIVFMVLFTAIAYLFSKKGI